MSKSKKVENENGTNVEMLNAYKHQHMIVRNFNALTLTRTSSPLILFLFSTFSFLGIFMFRHFYFRPKLGLPSEILATVPTMEKTVQKYPCFTSFLIVYRFSIGKTEITHFSGFPHSIERFEYYKTT